MFQLLTFPISPKSETELSGTLELLDPSELFDLTFPHLSLQLGSILVPYFLPNRFWYNERFSLAYWISLGEYSDWLASI